MSKRRKDEEPEPCEETMVSDVIPDHVHTCEGEHDLYLDHFCKSCGRWWGRGDEDAKSQPEKA